MALKYVVKKATFGFDKDKAEKYVAKPFNVVNVDFIISSLRTIPSS